jgi:hypothetical protein
VVKEVVKLVEVKSEKVNKPVQKKRPAATSSISDSTFKKLIEQLPIIIAKLTVLELGIAKQATRTEKSNHENIKMIINSTLEIVRIFNKNV